MKFENDGGQNRRQCFENKDKLSLFCTQEFEVLVEAITFMVPRKIAIISRIKYFICFLSEPEGAPRFVEVKPLTTTSVRVSWEVQILI